MPHYAVFSRDMDDFCFATDAKTEKDAAREYIKTLNLSTDFPESDLLRQFYVYKVTKAERKAVENWNGDDETFPLTGAEKLFFV